MTKVVIKAADGTGAVESYHNANKKLETTSAGVTVTGNIAVTGTVDGRDLATDGTKLDGIEASATADQTNAEIRAAVEAATDSNVFTDADHTKLNGIASSATSVGGATGVDFNDNVKVRFGTGNDLEIYHDASNTHFINNTGWLKIANDDANTSEAIYIRPKGDENSVILRPNGNVELYYDHAKKLETISWGVDCQGNTRTSGDFVCVDSGKFRAGNSGDVALYHNGATSFLEDIAGDLRIRSDALKLQSAGGENYIHCTANGAVQIYNDNIKIFQTDANGIQVIGPEGGSANLYLYGDEGDDNNDKWVFIAYDGEFSLQNYTSGSWETNIKGTGNEGVELYYDNSKKLHTKSSGVRITGHLELSDNENIKLGANSDLQLYHDGNHSYIHDGGTGDLRITGSTIKLSDSAQSENMIEATENGAVKLYYDNVKKFETTSAGVEVTGTLVFDSSISGGTITLQDDQKLFLGAGNDLQLFHDASHSWIKDNGTGHLKITTSNLRINNAANTENLITAEENGYAKLFYDDSNKLETTAAGIWVNGALKGDSLELSDNKKIILGTGDDLEIYHNGSHSVIDNVGTGALKLVTDHSLQVRKANPSTGEYLLQAIPDGRVDLFYDGVEKAYTTANGLVVRNSLSVSNNPTDSYYGLSTTYNYIHTNQSSAPCAIFEHSNDNNPQGVYIYFSDDSPDNNTKYFLSCDDNAGARARIYSDGDMWNHDDSFTGSDQTLKENIVDATPKLEDLKKLKVRNFNWKSEYFPEKSKKKQIGFIAQEVEQVFPALVSEHDIATGVHDDNHTPLMKKAIKQAWDPIIIKAMQELITKVETLETKVAALEAG